MWQNHQMMDCVFRSWSSEQSWPQTGLVPYLILSISSLPHKHSWVQCHLLVELVLALTRACEGGSCSTSIWSLACFALYVTIMRTKYHLGIWPGKKNETKQVTLQFFRSESTQALGSSTNLVTAGLQIKLFLKYWCNFIAAVIKVSSQMAIDDWSVDWVHKNTWMISEAFCRSELS